MTELNTGSRELAVWDDDDRGGDAWDVEVCGEAWAGDACCTVDSRGFDARDAAAKEAEAPGPALKESGFCSLTCNLRKRLSIW